MRRAQHPFRMQRLHPFPMPGPLSGTRRPALIVLDEDFCLPAPAKALAPAPGNPQLNAMPPPALRVTAKALNGSDDPFADDFMTGQMTGNDGQAQLDLGPRIPHLPRFVPLPPEIYAITRDPWSIHSVADLLRLYLPEVSISVGAVAFSGIMAGQIAHHFIHSIEELWGLAAYLGLLLMNIASLYFGAKGKPSMQVKEGFRNLLIACILLCIPHLVASAILKAAA